MESQLKKVHLDLKAVIEDKKDDLISLTQDLVRIPTLNPPGENYLEGMDLRDAKPRRFSFCIRRRTSSYSWSVC